MIATAELIVFKTMEGTFGFREVVRDEDGDIVGVSPEEITPFGNSLEELAYDLTMFVASLEKPYLCEEDLEYEELDGEVEIVQVEGGSNVH